MTREKARELLMTILFQMDARDDIKSEDIDLFIDKIEMGNQKDYIESILSLACDNIETIDNEISSFSTKWKLSRIPKTDLAILRLATAEILYSEEIPDSVAINEAVDLAKRYCDDNSPSYINGILGSIMKKKSNK